MSYVVSLIGPPAAGKTTFAKWFVDRNPVYCHIDVAAYRKHFGVTEKRIKNEIRLKRESVAWQHIKEAVHRSGCAVIESTGLSHRLRDVMDTTSSSCAIKFLADPSVLNQRIIRRNNANSDLELMYLEQDLFEIQKIPVDIVCQDLGPAKFATLEEQIFLFMLERYKTDSQLGD